MPLQVTTISYDPFRLSGLMRKENVMVSDQISTFCVCVCVWEMMRNKMDIAFTHIFHHLSPIYSNTWLVMLDFPFFYFISFSY